MSKSAKAESSERPQSLKARKNPYLKKAVHNNKALSREGLLERMFTGMFKGFVYPQIWEDPAVDMDALDIQEGDHIVTIASGGCNALNYLTANPGKVTAIDLNPAHIALNRLKIAGVKHLPDYDSFFQFFGAANTKDNLALYERYIAPNLDEETRDFWNSRMLPSGRRRIALFANNLYRYGLLGRFIGTLHFVSKLYGQDPREILQARNREEQTELFNKTLGPIFDKKLVRMCCNLPVTLYGLGIPPAQYKALSEDAEGSVADLLKERLRHLACDYPLETNYFAWQAFGRSYDLENRQAVPYYLHQDYYETLKNRIDKLDIRYILMTDLLESMDSDSVNGFVFLDAQDWMNDDQLNALWSQVQRTAAPGARVIYRTAGKDTILPGHVQDDILKNWDYDPEQGRKWHKQDRSSIYGGFHRYTLKESA